MFRLAKMYCYRLFRKKGIYMTCLLLAGFEFLIKMMLENGSVSEIFARVGTFYLLFSAIAPAMFFCTDISTGFIKNYAGTMPDRGLITGARAIVAIVENIIFMTAFTLTALIVAKADLGDESFLVYGGAALFVAGVGMSFVSICVTELLRKTVASIVTMMVIGFGLAGQLVPSLIALITKIDTQPFFITCAVETMGNTQTMGDIVKTIAVSAGYIVCAYIISVVSIRKRDVV